MVESTPGSIGGPMFTSAFRILTAAAVTGIALAPGAASAAALRPAALTYFSSSTPAGGDPDTTVTFAVTTGALTMTAPTSANLGAGAPGTTISGLLGSITVTDDRALLTAAWTVAASETDWLLVGGGNTSAETIPAADATYDPGDITTTGTITAAAASTPPIALANGATPVVAGTAGVGDNTATWNPTIAVAVPAGAVGGDYSGTLTQSVA
jgi:hypothetical protein